MSLLLVTRAAKATTIRSPSWPEGHRRSVRSAGMTTASVLNSARSAPRRSRAPARIVGPNSRRRPNFARPPPIRGPEDLAGWTETIKRHADA